MARRWVLACVTALLVLAGPAPSAGAAECCAITAINLRTGVVTAEDPAKRRFFVHVDNAVLLNRLKAGQAVDVDERNGIATITGITGRFSLVDSANYRAEDVAVAAPEPRPSWVAPPRDGERDAAPPPHPVPYRGPAPSNRQPTPQSGGAATAAAPAAPAADPAPSGGRGSIGGKPTGKRDPRAEDPPSDDANEDEEPDPPKLQRGFGKGLGRGAAAGGKTVRLDKYPDARGFAQKLADAFARREMNVALLGGEKYMLNSCLGIKVRAGAFKMKLAKPDARVEGTAAKLSFRVERISLSGISLRMRPNSNVLKPCHFSKKFTVGGAASDVKVELRFDPVMDLASCKLGSLGQVHVRVGIGNLNLKPLQNDLDRVAKNMIEDAVNYAFEADPVDQVIQTIDDVLEVDCPGKRAQAG